MFVDTAKIELQAGKGGDGAVSFRHEIYIPKGGPDGGNGGKGGDIIFRADKDTNTLIAFRFNPILKAENGKPGSGQRAAGRSGQDLIVKVPIGTVIYKITEVSTDIDQTKDGNSNQYIKEPLSSRTLLADLTYDGQEAIIAKGGDGGFGNAHFKSSTRQTPRIAEVGEPGEAFTAELELKLLADVGLVGLPSAGKSTFLATVTNATPEIADYPFTTLTPNLGIATIDNHDILIADIPGLIEGASEGKGLGTAFLRHIDRTSVLLHLIDIYNDDAGEAYATIRHELEKYSNLSTRPEIIALTKCEGLDDDIIEMQKQSILKKNPSAKIFTISSVAHLGTTDLLRSLYEIINSSANQSDTATSSLNSKSKLPQSQIENHNKTIASMDQTNDDSFKQGMKEPSPQKTTDIPIIKLSDKAYADTWNVEKTSDGVYHVRGAKIEKFARRTDLSNYASVNRLRDIMKKLGIRAELTTQGAKPDSIIEIAGKEFTLVEDY